VDILATFLKGAAIGVVLLVLGAVAYVCMAIIVQACNANSVWGWGLLAVLFVLFCGGMEVFAR
jgi:hypothetical protein